MGTMTFSISSTLGSRVKAFTFPDANSQDILNAASSMYPAASVGASLDAWFADLMAEMTASVLQNKRSVATAAAIGGITDIPIT
jgi:hypothetical protein